MRGATAYASASRNEEEVFQSTLLMRGATSQALPTKARGSISIHAPHARSDGHGRNLRCGHRHFNPRSSCEERQYLRLTRPRTYRFQSTLLMRGATGLRRLPALFFLNFNPRSSCEERHNISFTEITPSISIHAPHARSDSPIEYARAVLRISIHAPHARSDGFPHPALLRPPISIHAPHARSDSS